jgi:hypothetical protein
MPPVHPPRKDDGHPCRVCGCTEHNACPDARIIPLTPEQKRHRSSPMAFACSWVETSGADEPRWLCSACFGTIEDALEVIGRIDNLIGRGDLPRARSVALAFIVRAKKRQRGLMPA